MAAAPQNWVIENAQAVADEHGLLQLQLRVAQPGTNADTQTHIYRVDPDTAGDVIDVLLRVAEDANPGSSEA